MMTSLTPVGELARQQRWWVTTTAYLVGSLVGGLAVGALLGAVSVPVRGIVPEPVAVGLFALVGALGLLADAGRLPLPSVHRQVDEGWMQAYRGWVYGGGYGLQLGTGVATIVTSSATWLVMAAAALSGSVTAGVAIGGTYGLVRALPLLGFARVRTPARLRRAMQRMETWRAPAAHVTTVGQAALVVVAIGALVTGTTTWR